MEQIWSYTNNIRVAYINLLRKVILNVKLTLKETLTRLHCDYSPKGMKVDSLLGLTREVESLNKGNYYLVSTSPPEYTKLILSGFKKALRYEPTVEEIRHVIQDEGSFFVQRLEILIFPWVEGINEGGGESFLDEKIKAELIAKNTQELATTERQLLLHMNGGKGERSCANNSLLQKKLMLKAKPILEETIMKLYHDSSPNCMKVADLGCSVGPNSLLVISNIINIVDTTCTILNCEPPTFQFYLNDLFGNDFNTIFKSLPDFHTRLVEDKGHKFGSCFINATPGSFYGRLFPSNSIDLFHSSNSLHWLSQDPLLGLTKEAESLYKGHCHIVSTSPPEVYKAYLKQFQQDFKLFLKSRSEELVPGGAMLLVVLGNHETPRRTGWELISLILNDMFLEGLIEEEKLNSFNIPVYEPTVEEIRHVIQEEGSFFVQRLEILILPWVEGINEAGDDSFLDGNIKAGLMAKHVRAAMEPLLSSKFGEEVINEVFIRYQKKVVQLMEVEKLECATFMISMTKNA
ncbi:7-methylxanthosine synthase 1 [Glycine soja]